jgi:hypothetical protein
MPARVAVRLALVAVALIVVMFAARIAGGMT